jgi:Fe-S-cluster containining protein
MTSHRENMIEKSKEPVIDNDDCEQCGLCCRIFGNSITPTLMNLYSWIEQERKDILQYFSAARDDGSWVNCADILPEDLGSVLLVEMRDPRTGEYLTVCPFLKRTGKDRYICGIHSIKPDMCRNYQPWVWGETYFGRCKSLKKSDNRYIWRHICE